MFRLLLSIIFVGFGCSVFGQGSFHYVSYHQGTLHGANRSYFDFDQNGTDDLSIQHVCYSHGGSVSCHLLTGYESEIRILTQTSTFGEAAILETGDLIASGFAVRETVFQEEGELGRYSWVGEIPLGSAPTLAYGDGSELQGIWAHDESIIGIQFFGEAGYHNGWVRFELDPNYPEHKFYRVADWAYNLNPGEPILAGMLQVPEPSTWVLLLVGGAALLTLFKARRAELRIAPGLKPGVFGKP